MLALLQRNMDSKGKQAKLKSPQQLQELLEVTRELLAEFGDTIKEEDAETVEKLKIVKVRHDLFPLTLPKPTHRKTAEKAWPAQYIFSMKALERTPFKQLELG